MLRIIYDPTPIPGSTFHRAVVLEYMNHQWVRVALAHYSPSAPKRSRLTNILAVDGQMKPSPRALASATVSIHE